MTDLFVAGEKNLSPKLNQACEANAAVIIRKIDTEYQALDGRTKSKIDHSTTAKTVIDSALANLTAARTWRELVYIKDSITLTDKIVVPSYTHIHTDATVTMANSTNKHVWDCGDSVATKNEVEISGGFYNLGTQAAGQVVYCNATDAYIHDFRVSGGYLPIYIYPDSTNVRVRRVKLSSPSIQGINISGINCGAKDCYITGGCTEFGIIVAEGYQNYAIHNYLTALSATSSAIELGYNSQGNIIKDNTIKDCLGGGIVALSKDSSYFAELTKTTKAQIKDNIITGTARPILLETAFAGTYPIEDSEVSGNQIEVQDSGYGISGSVTSTATTANIKSVRVHDNIMRKATGATGTTGLIFAGEDIDLYDNDVTGLATPIDLTAGTTWQVRFKVAGNTGYNPKGHIAQPFSATTGNIYDKASDQDYPSSTVTYTVRGSPKLVTIWSGTVSEIMIDGTASGLTSGAFSLQPGQTLKVTWSSQPWATVYMQ